MTVGQRIAQKRKEQALSQEALGEVLGVSRQSVYKWESGSALPEIDKLITMSRLFGVTTGWLLGVEEEVKAAPAESGELTDTQLKMVEEIVTRYLAAQQPVKRRRWPWAAGAAAGLALLLALSSLRGELQTMQNQYNALQSSVNSVTSSVNTQIHGITARVEEVLKAQNTLTVRYGTEIISADLAAGTISFSAYAVPKTYTEGMTAVFIVDDGFGPTEIPGELGENQTFSAGLACKLTDGISISVVFVTGEVRETQLLESYCNLYGESLPYADYYNPHSAMMWKKPNEQGELDWSGEYAYFCRQDGASSDGGSSRIGRSEIQFLQVGLFRNQKLLGWLTPCDQPKNYHSFEDGTFYQFPDVSVTPQAGDVFTVSAVIVDEYGREFVVRGIPYGMNPEFGEMTSVDGGWVGWDDPADRKSVV